MARSGVEGREGAELLPAGKCTSDSHPVTDVSGPYSVHAVSFCPQH